MRIVIAGGSGQVGRLLTRAFLRDDFEVVILSREQQLSCEKQGPTARVVLWDGKTLGDWAAEIDGADVVINLAGRSVDCRYHPHNRRAMRDSRVDSTRVIGAAIVQATNPPPVWLQASTATIYSHRFDALNDDLTGELGGSERGAPRIWRFSTEVAKAWEAACNEVELPRTRKVLLRSAMTMSPDAGGIFDVLLRLVRRGLGGTCGNGKQFVSWIHERDFVRCIYWLIENDMSGPVNLASPEPLPNADFMQALREAWGKDFGLPASRWMLEIGAFFMRTETELILKSRRVVPTRLQQAGFEFEYPNWKNAAAELCTRWRTGNHHC